MHSTVKKCLLIDFFVCPYFLYAPLDEPLLLALTFKGKSILFARTFISTFLGDVQFVVISCLLSCDYMACFSLSEPPIIFAPLVNNFKNDFWVVKWRHG